MYTFYNQLARSQFRITLTQVSLKAEDLVFHRQWSKLYRGEGDVKQGVSSISNCCGSASVYLAPSSD